jgi:hypothetical protein
MVEKAQAGRKESGCIEAIRKWKEKWDNALKNNNVIDILNVPVDAVMAITNKLGNIVKKIFR